MRILVADDDKFFLEIIRKICEGAGHTVRLARDGEEALAAAIDFEPELCIMDVVLPKLLGTEVCRKLRSSPRLSSVPVLLMSSGVAEIEAAGGDPGEFQADDFIHKPFRPERLLERIERFSAQGSAYGKKSRMALPRHDDRRKAIRLPIDVEITAHSAQAILQHPLINISTGGVYMEVERPLRPGEVVELRFSIPDAGMVAARGEVAWCLELTPQSLWGLGIRFLEISPDSLARIQRYLEALLHTSKPTGADAIEKEGPAEVVVPVRIGDRNGK